MTNAALRGKPDAVNPHVAPSQCYGDIGRFDESGRFYMMRTLKIKVALLVVAGVRPFLFFSPDKFWHSPKL